MKRVTYALTLTLVLALISHSCLLAEHGAADPTRCGDDATVQSGTRSIKAEASGTSTTVIRADLNLPTLFQVDQVELVPLTSLSSSSRIASPRVASVNGFLMYLPAPSFCISATRSVSEKPLMTMVFCRG